MLRQSYNVTLTRARSSDDPIPDSGMIMNSIVTHEQCERRIQAVLKKFGSTEQRGRFDMVWIESRLRDRRGNDESE